MFTSVALLGILQLVRTLYVFSCELQKSGKSCVFIIKFYQRLKRVKLINILRIFFSNLNNIELYPNEKYQNNSGKWKWIILAENAYFL